MNKALPLACALLLSTPAHAEIFVPLADLVGMGNTEAGVALTRSEADYSTSKSQEVSVTITDDDGDTFEGMADLEFDDPDGTITRTMLSGYFTKGIRENIDLYGVAALTFSSKLSGFEDDDESYSGSGSGFIFGGGVRGTVPHTVTENLDLSWYGQLLLIDEDYGSDTDEDDVKVTISGKATELAAGIIGSKNIDPSLTVYGGLELLLTDSIDLSVKVSDDDTSARYSFDIDRDSQIGLRLGALKDNFFFNAALLSELTLSVGYRIPLL